MAGYFENNLWRSAVLLLLTEGISQTSLTVICNGMGL
jgi:hypothetical protein